MFKSDRKSTAVKSLSKSPKTVRIFYTDKYPFICNTSFRIVRVRNRQNLCHCGQSANKPFCDGKHASMEFQDGLSKYAQK
ncbi:CDGSH iron-sulfur domain-containing protein [Sphingobacterium athyrii]|uniref:Iron-binding zinc finger CDGSH type domain-containing protein n=1 Tax=Sphingobacterium athyrii TaxID=2152717 RepID=A0A363NKH9_9SPHI|nr:hypothetical protein DCO56_27970 [Sphingobacterium athyrii]